MRHTLVTLALASACLAAHAADYELDRSACEEREYPLTALANGESGTTILRFRIDAEGKAYEIYVSNPSGFPKLDRAARRNLETCKLQQPADNPKAKFEVIYKWIPKNPRTSARMYQLRDDFGP
jgi:TonB family protein